eukprot:CAMPEP_0202917550 /NCGR_PEP_ID=MMETSP1392-20130828/71242_1 /ASSEMBLY_ACC=CAM_ASM_000868 /TAXON_ID=225041 /ORGANISM="Chlamydomonas chlamydogama, Strain SAG 11-48b" /LENGTH=131 /DNA_ID=CAMNT_0049610327 /DNA_START=823 /DNA_END=1215 /DNA_ORIENTATION=-
MIGATAKQQCYCRGRFEPRGFAAPASRHAHAPAGLRFGPLLHALDRCFTDGVDSPKLAKLSTACASLSVLLALTSCSQLCTVLPLDIMARLSLDVGPDAGEAAPSLGVRRVMTAWRTGSSTGCETAPSTVE